jgi:aspartyl-tRNA(Asn)/glutamyl-tRNA(Gln) amidotransferase subunit C
MPSPINKDAIKHLAKLARLELDENEEKKLLKDLQKILEHFEELKQVSTENVEPLSGGTEIKNAFREDEERGDTNRGAGVEAFPETNGGFLKIPPVFSAEGGSASGGE